MIFWCFQFNQICPGIVFRLLAALNFTKSVSSMCSFIFDMSDNVFPFLASNQQDDGKSDIVTKCTARQFRWSK
jgi:hypothetical protein